MLVWIHFRYENIWSFVKYICISNDRPLSGEDITTSVFRVSRLRMYYPIKKYYIPIEEINILQETMKTLLDFPKILPDSYFLYEKGISYSNLIHTCSFPI